MKRQIIPPTKWSIPMIMLIIILTASTFLYADIYKYIDENGVTYFTNIPPHNKYQKVIHGEKARKNIPEVYNHVIDRESKKHNIKPSLVKAVIKTESDWDITAVSKKGAIGLMQLMPPTAAEMQVDPFNPEENIKGGVKYLKYLLDKFNGDLTLALAAYNAGPKKIEKFNDIPPIPETQQYVEKILTIYNGGSSEETPTIIYKIIQEDGTVLYTNTPAADVKSTRINF